MEHSETLLLSRRAFVAASITALGAAALSGCSSSSFMDDLDELYGEPLIVAYAPYSSRQSVADGFADMVSSDGALLSVDISAGRIYTSDGSSIDGSDIASGDRFRLYVAGGVDGIDADDVTAAALVLTASGGASVAKRFNKKLADAEGWSVKLVYTPLSDAAHEAVVTGERSHISCVLVEDGSKDVAYASLPDLAMYDRLGRLMDVSELEPGDTFTAYSLMAEETYPAHHELCRMELKTRGGQEAVDDLSSVLEDFDLSV